MFEIKIIEEFSAAHQLHGYIGKCANLHGHNWQIEVVVRSNKLNLVGLSIDFKDLKAKTKELLNTLDHFNLNDNPYFKERNPTAENVAYFLYTNLKKSLCDFKEINVSRVNVWETRNSCASYFEE